MINSSALRLKFKLAAGVSLLALAACGGTYRSPILIERGVKPFEREYFVTQESYGISRELQESFLNGTVTEGMTQEMVSMLWGPPDREFADGTQWEYTTKQGATITKVTFSKKFQERLDRKERVVIAIEGDRFGGSPPATGTGNADTSGRAPESSSP